MRYMERLPALQGESVEFLMPDLPKLGVEGLGFRFRGVGFRV